MKFGVMFVLVCAVLLFTLNVAAQESGSNDGSMSVQADEQVSTLLLGNGTVRVQFISNPTGATVAVDGVNRGTAPVTVYLAPGTHRAVLTNSGRLTANFQFTVREGYSYRYTVNMGAGNGSVPVPAFFSQVLLAQGYPSGRDVVLICDVRGGSGNYLYYWNFGDGATQTTSTRDVFHTYPADARYTARCTVRDVRTGAILSSYRVIPIGATSVGGRNATVKITSNPSGAAITIDNVAYGPAPQTLSLMPGEHTFRFTLDGYRDRTTTIRLRSGGIYNLGARLVPGSSGGSGGGPPPSGGTVNLQVAAWYPKGYDVVWECTNSFGSQAAQYQYMFGDGSSLTLDRDDVYHTYPSEGTYTAQCIVRSSNGQELGRSSKSVTVA